MNWEGIAAIATGIGLLISVLGVVFAGGKIVSRLETLEARTKEDRERNGDDHREFRETSACVGGIAVKMDNVEKILDGLRRDITAILQGMANGVKP
jgi:hypothetical protein